LEKKARRELSGRQTRLCLYARINAKEKKGARKKEGQIIFAIDREINHSDKKLGAKKDRGTQRGTERRRPHRNEGSREKKGRARFSCLLVKKAGLERRTLGTKMQDALTFQVSVRGGEGSS